MPFVSLVVGGLTRVVIPGKMKTKYALFYLLVTVSSQVGTVRPRGAF